MATLTLQQAIIRAKNLLALEALILEREQQRYQQQLRTLLVQLETLAKQLRHTYHLSLADLLHYANLPEDMQTLLSLIAQLKQQLRHYSPVPVLTAPKLAANRYAFFAV